MPDAAADPSTSLRSFLAPLRCRAGSFAAAWWWRVAPLVRLRRLFLGVATPTPPLLRIFWVAVKGSQAPSGIDAPERKSAPTRRGSKEASASGQPECSGVLRSCLTSQPASPGLAAARPSTHWQPSGLRKKSSAPRPPASCCGSFLTSTPRLRPPIRGGVFGNALRERLSRNRSVLARAAASGRSWHQALSSSLPALPRSCLACAAWSLLRERLTPRPPAAGSNYRFGFRQNKLGSTCSAGEAGKQGLVNDSTLLNRGAASVAVGAGRSRLGKPGSGVIRPHRAASKSGRAFPAQPQPSPALGAGGSASANASPPLHRPTHGN